MSMPKRMSSPAQLSARAVDGAQLFGRQGFSRFGDHVVGVVHHHVETTVTLALLGGGGVGKGQGPHVQLDSVHEQPLSGVQLCQVGGHRGVAATTGAHPGDDVRPARAGERAVR
ncbi:hypothetical protein [Kineococcus sp. G2]|uniref:hypothetical protein n=1 Tax=Kineococcus sp. G2 TaxID=3127484 RepID=UPI00301DB3EE